MIGCVLVVGALCFGVVVAVFLCACRFDVDAVDYLMIVCVYCFCFCACNCCVSVLLLRVYVCWLVDCERIVF